MSRSTVHTICLFVVTPKLYMGRLSNSYMLRAYLFNNKLAMNNSLGLFL